MKYVLIIPDGAADFPLEELDGQTPFEAANKPHTDRLSMMGRRGTVRTTPEPFSAGSDVCSMSLLGYDPCQYHTGRAPIEAAAMGIEMNEGDWIFRCNLVTVLDGVMMDHSAGHISSNEGRQLLEDFINTISDEGLGDGCVFYPGISYRNIMVDRSGRNYGALTSTPPHDIPGEQAKKYLPRGGDSAELIQALMERSVSFFAEHEVNRTRIEMGESPATQIWLWGQGEPPQLESFEKRYGLRGAMITAVDLLAGIANLIGWDRLEVPGITGYHDTNYKGKGQHAIEALDRYDFVCVHVEAPDEASHQADASTKVASIEAIDEHIVGPILEHLEQGDEDWRILYLPDHYTRVDNRKHDATPVPFCMAGKGVKNVVEKPFNEQTAEEADLHIEYGHELMEFFLKSGQ